MRDRKGTAEAAAASFAAGVTVLFCAGIVLTTAAACGVRVSAQDFPVLKLSGPDDTAKK